MFIEITLIILVAISLNFMARYTVRVIYQLRGTHVYKFTRHILTSMYTTMIVAILAVFFIPSPFNPTIVAPIYLIVQSVCTTLLE